MGTQERMLEPIFFSCMDRMDAEFCITPRRGIRERMLEPIFFSFMDRMDAEFS